MCDDLMSRLLADLHLSLDRLVEDLLPDRPDLAAAIAERVRAVATAEREVNEGSRARSRRTRLAR
jgi:hypothetical protein